MPAKAGSGPAPSYARSTRSPRGEHRRRELLAAVTDDIAANGLSDFSLRRAARAAGATHKVLLYHFDGVEDLLTQAVGELRRRRVEGGLAAALSPDGSRESLADRVRAIWPVLNVGAEARALDEALGLALYEPERYAGLAAAALDDYLPPLIELCPAGWTDAHKRRVAHFVLATLRGLVLATRTSPAAVDPEAVLAVLCTALEREELAPK